MNRCFKPCKRNFILKNNLFNKETYSLSSSKSKFMSSRNFSVLDSTFIKEVQYLKDQPNLNYPKEIYDIFENSTKDSKSSSEFKVLLLDDPEKFFDILSDNLITITKYSSDLSSEAINIFIKILDYVNITFQHILLYENCLLTFNHYKKFINLLIEEILRNKSSKKLQFELEKFLKEKLEKLDYKTNIYVLYLLNTILRQKLVYKYNLITLFHDFHKKNTDDYFNRNYESPIGLEIIIEPLELFCLNFVRNHFIDFLIMTKKENFKTFLIKNSIVEDTSDQSTPELIVELCDLMSLSYTLLYSEIGNLKLESFSKFLLSLDEVISQYVISPQSSHQLIYTLLHNFFFSRITFKIGGGLTLINTFNALCRAFIMRSGEKNEFYFFLMRLFLKENHKASFTAISVTNTFKACYFYIHDYINQEQNYKNYNSILLLDIINFLTSVKFDIGKKLTDELMSRIDIIMEDRSFDFNSMLIMTTISHFDNPDHSAIRKIMTNPRMNYLPAKKFINIGYYGSLSKYNEYEVWKEWVDILIRRFPVNKLNFFDIKMLKLMKSIFNITNPEINKVFGPYVDKLKINEPRSNRNFHRWFHSQNLNRESLLELPFSHYLDRMNIIYKTQFLIPENDMDADYLLGDKIIVEICGPSHYLVNNQFKMDQKTKIKKEILESKGYYCFFISWISMPIDFNLQGNFILEEIKREVPDEEYQKIFRKNRK
jgi:hypothetical protein